MIKQLIECLQGIALDLDGEDLADVLWLAMQMKPTEPFGDAGGRREKVVVETARAIADPQPQSAPAARPLKLPLYVAPAPPQQQTETVVSGIPFQAPAAAALRNPLDLGRALRPLMRKVPSQRETILDEDATATQIAERKIWTPVLQPAPERWLDLALVIEDSRSTAIWQSTLDEFQRLAEHQGAFRDVRPWRLKRANDGTLSLFPKRSGSTQGQRPRSPNELLDPTGRKLVLLLSDCTSALWRQGQIYPLLKQWSQDGPLAIVQLLPERLWGRSALGTGFPVQLSALTPGVANAQLAVEGLPRWQDIDLTATLSLPVVTLEAAALQHWARVVAGAGNTRAAGILLETAMAAATVETAPVPKESQRSAPEIVKRFRTTASPLARRLAGLIAAAPVSLPIIHLIQETLLPDSQQVHIAEVFMSGLLQATPSDREDPEVGIVRYEFVQGVRDLLIDSVPIPDIDTVLEAVSQYIARKAGLSIHSFAALLSPASDWNENAQPDVIPFARIATQVLRRLGGDYAILAAQLERKRTPPDPSVQFPPLQSFEFDVATLASESAPAPDDGLQPFPFTTVTVDATGQESERRQNQAYGFAEPLGPDLTLEMVSIPPGRFRMGSPESEPDRYSDESPQHSVTMPPFFLGKYPITQAQWRAVAALPQIERDLAPDPSHFKGDNRPVERVSWLEAVEFCARLSQASGREYRLPSEAEWEYACRAGTTTPFHFGETTTTSLANYQGTDDEDLDWSGSYEQGPKGIYREGTLPVGSFGVANNFGLYDMHGNIWEWCTDHWHENYEDAPGDGSVWIENNNDNYLPVLRGGSWDSFPGVCRSAYRGRGNADRRNYCFGFRVACSAA